MASRNCVVPARQLRENEHGREPDMKCHFTNFVTALSLFVLPALMSITGLVRGSDNPPLATTRPTIDAATLHHKVLCGYQGWFRCPGDGTNEGWKHWSRRRETIMPKSLTFEMWPDMTEYTDDEKYAAPGLTYPDGK